VYFDVNDFDESAPAPASWDLVRFLSSLRVGADSLSISETTAQMLCQILLKAYTTALALGKAYRVGRDTAQGLARGLLDRVRSRQRASFLDSRSVTKRRQRLLRVDGKRALLHIDQGDCLSCALSARFSALRLKARRTAKGRKQQFAGCRSCRWVPPSSPPSSSLTELGK